MGSATIPRASHEQPRDNCGARDAAKCRWHAASWRENADLIALCWDSGHVNVSQVMNHNAILYSMHRRIGLLHGY